ncbi:FAS1-like dehydratase domain-containing protein [Mycolicibacterium palauense]|uniref:FAS1-like dehydratase domain-containing protein n=1 Tax=Mycolicibacterium palauense TaxID=2034511 RepID=UPI000BFEF651|nr:MaoC family dehydratase N-terminal domain-containing protein [Mycolicibacterium palauense]
MAIAEDIIGTHYRYHDHFKVGREKIREFAKALKDDNPVHYDEKVAAEAGYSSLPATLTFIAVAGRRVQLEMFKRFDVGINLARVIHRDQKLQFHRPIVAGDELYFDSYLDSVLQSHGTIISELRSEVTDAEGKPVLTSVVTMIGEAISDEHTDAQVAAIASRIAGP